MRSAHVRLLALTFVFLLARALPLKAQTLAGVEQGIKPYGSYEGGDIDSVSMANGSLTLNLPLISYPQRGGKLNVGFNLVYANPWLQPWASHCNPFNHFCSNTGYNLVYFTDPSTCGYTNPSGGTCGTAMSVPASFARSIGEVYQGPQCCPQTVRYFTVTEPDGSVHELGGSAPARSVDATGYAFWPGTDPNTGTLDTAGRLYDRQGNLYDFTTGQPGKVEDPNGNLVTATTTGWTDTMGRAIPAPSGATSTTDLSHCPSSPRPQSYGVHLVRMEPLHSTNSAGPPSTSPSLPQTAAGVVPQPLQRRQRW